MFMLLHMFVPDLSRPFIINFTKPSRNTMSWSLLVHLVVLEIMTLAAVMAPVKVLIPYITQAGRIRIYLSCQELMELAPQL